MSKSERGPKRPRLENGRKMSLVQAGIWDSGVSEGRAQMELELRLKHRVALDTVRIKAHLRTCIVCKEDRLCEYKCVFCATSLCSGCQIQLAAPAKYRAGIDDLNVVKTPPPPPKCPNCSEKLTLMHEPVTRQLDNGEFARAACKHKCGFFVVGPMYLDKSGKRSSSEAVPVFRVRPRRLLWKRRARPGHGAGAAVDLGTHSLGIRRDAARKVSVGLQPAGAQL